MCSNKKTNARKKNYILAFLFLALVSIPSVAGAQIFSQTSTSSGAIVPQLLPLSNEGFGIDLFFDVPFGTTGFIESFDFFFSGKPSAGSTGVSVIILEFEDPNFLTPTTTITTDYVIDDIRSCNFIPVGSLPALYSLGVAKDRFSPGGLTATSSFFMRADRGYRIELQDCFANFFNGTAPANIFGSGVATTTGCWLGDDPNGTLRTCADSGLDYPFLIMNEFSGNTTVNEIIAPTAGTTTATTTVNVIVDFFNSGNADVITLFIDDRVTGQQVPIFPFDFAVTGGFGTFDDNIELPEGSFTLRTGLFNTVTGSQHGNILRVDFNVISNQVEEVFGVDIFDTEDLLNLATSTCGITNLSGCFQNALVFAFVPSEASFDRFITLKDSLINKPPFGYFALLAGGLSALNSTSSPAFVLATEDNIVTTIFDPVKTGLNWLLWVFFGVYLYKRVIAIQL